MPGYIDSDDSDDENLETSEKPLFPSSSSSYHKNSQSIKNIEIQTETSSQSDPQTLNSPKREDKKQKPSFASIITGGRSPQQETVDMIYGPNNKNIDEATNKTANDCNETEILPQKTFQRKRRIEFNVESTQAKRKHQSQDEDINLDTEPLKEVSNSTATLKNKYSNFQKGGTEFVKEQQPSSEPNVTEVETVDLAANHIRDEQQCLEGKLNFLCQNREDVSPVQIIQIQLQVSQHCNQPF